MLQGLHVYRSHSWVSIDFDSELQGNVVFLRLKLCSCLCYYVLWILWSFFVQSLWSDILAVSFQIQFLMSHVTSDYCLNWSKAWITIRLNIQALRRFLKQVSISGRSDHESQFWKRHSAIAKLGPYIIYVIISYHILISHVTYQTHIIINHKSYQWSYQSYHVVNHILSYNL